jgi:hypothetical protein
MRRSNSSMHFAECISSHVVIFHKGKIVADDSMELLRTFTTNCQSGLPRIGPGAWPHSDLSTQMGNQLAPGAWCRIQTDSGVDPQLLLGRKDLTKTQTTTNQLHAGAKHPAISPTRLTSSRYNSIRLKSDHRGTFLERENCKSIG